MLRMDIHDYLFQLLIDIVWYTCGKGVLQHLAIPETHLSVLKHMLSSII